MLGDIILLYTKKSDSNYFKHTQKRNGHFKNDFSHQQRENSKVIQKLTIINLLCLGTSRS